MKPDLLLIVDEQGMYGRCFLAAAQAHGIATVGVQHGLISQDDGRYTHAAGMVPPNGRFVGTTLCPIPDATAVYGELYRRVLVEKGGYPENSVTVTGQPSYDFIHSMRDDGAKERVCRQLSIDPAERIAALVTHTHGTLDPDHNRQVLEIVFEAMRRSSRGKLVVRLDRAEEPSLHRHIALGKGVLSSIVIMKDVKLFDLLRACDMVITSRPKVVLDAMLCGKPAIAVNVTAGRDAMPYAGSGAVLCVSNAEELVKAIETVSTDDDLQKKLREARREFLADCLRPIDGSAARRVAELAVRMTRAHLSKTDEDQCKEA